MNSQQGESEHPQQSMADAPDRTGSEPPAIWKSYPIGAAGEAARAILSVAIPVGIGVGITLVLDVLVGVLYEEGIIYDVLSNAGMTYSDWEPISTAIDYSTRMSIVPTLLLGYAVLLVASTCVCVAGISTSRGLVKAVRDGASRREVPPPAQVESVIAKRFWALWFVCLGSGGALALFGIIALFNAVADDKPEWVLYGLLILAGAAIFGVVSWLLESKLYRAHRRRRLIIADWWTTADEQRAWDNARASVSRQHENANGSTTVNRDPRVLLARKILGFAGLLVSPSIIAFYAVLFIIYPNATRWGKGERADLDTEFQSVLNVVLVVVLAAVVLALVGMLVGNLLEGAGRRAERAALRRAAENPDSMRIAPSLLEDYSNRRTMLLATVIGALGTLLLIAGMTTLLLATTDNDLFRNAATQFSDYGVISLASIGIGVLLILTVGVWNAVIARRNADLRNLLMARWPQLPRETTESVRNSQKRRQIPSRVGPALTPGTEQDDLV